VLGRMINQHLDDAALAEVWTNAVADGTPPSHPHLVTCAECRLRFTSFTAWLDEVREDAAVEADLAFPAERLAAQQTQILRRLEVAGQPTRVIAFPKATAVAARPSPVRRWVAAAAAAGLVAGIGLGQLLDLRHRLDGPSTFPGDRAPIASVRTSPAAVPAVATLTEELSFPEIEELATPRYEALRAFDTFTPRAADLIAASR
jgi:hypothetical protein